MTRVASHLVWIPNYRRNILMGEVQAETKGLLSQCCGHHGLTLLALETDSDHIPVCLSALARFRPALMTNLLKELSSGYLQEEFPRLKKVCGKEHVWTSRSSVGTAGAVSGQRVQMGRVAFIPPPGTGRDFPLPLLRLFDCGYDAFT